MTGLRVVGGRVLWWKQTSGRANSMPEGGHVTRIIWAHQVTAASLSVRQKTAYQQYCDLHRIDDVLPTLSNR